MQNPTIIHNWSSGVDIIGGNISTTIVGWDKRHTKRGRWEIWEHARIRWWEHGWQKRWFSVDVLLDKPLEMGSGVGCSQWAPGIPYQVVLFFLVRYPATESSHLQNSQVNCWCASIPSSCGRSLSSDSAWHRLAWHRCWKRLLEFVKMWWCLQKNHGKLLCWSMGNLIFTCLKHIILLYK